MNLDSIDNTNDSDRGLTLCRTLNWWKHERRMRWEIGIYSHIDKNLVTSVRVIWWLFSLTLLTIISWPIWQFISVWSFTWIHLYSVVDLIKPKMLSWGFLVCLWTDGLPSTDTPCCPQYESDENHLSQAK